MLQFYNTNTNKSIQIMFPKTRLRRTKTNPSIRKLLQPFVLQKSDFVYPVFITVEPGKVPISALPGQYRIGLDILDKEAALWKSMGLMAINIYPVVPQNLKNLTGEEAYNPQGIIPQAICVIKKVYPEIVIFADIALDPYLEHGHDGVLYMESKNAWQEPANFCDNDTSIALLGKQAVCYAAAGADWVAPSDKMDGRTQTIRAALDTAGFPYVGILAYSAKYASQLYGPFRHAVGSNQKQYLDKKTYQLDPHHRALLDATQDLDQGADIILVKPGGWYTDILWEYKQQLSCFLAVFQVSGEYAMLEAAFAKNILDRQTTLLESMICFKRAGADLIFTYYAKDLVLLMHS
jgi:porphobilinogen synthase